MATPVRAGSAVAPPSPRRHLRVLAPPPPPADPCARTAGAQLRAVRDHRQAAQRRDGFRRARTLCEDLAELLPQRTAVHGDPSLGDVDRAQELKLLDAEICANTGELTFLAMRLCDRPRPAVERVCRGRGKEPCRRTDASDDTRGLDEVVEQLDEQLRDAELGYRDADRRVVDLAAVLVAGIHALAAESPPVAASPAPAPVPPAPPRCAHCGLACDRQDELGVFFCSAEHLLLARIAGTASSVLALPSRAVSSSASNGGGPGAAAEV